MSRPHLSLIIVLGLLIVSPPLWFYASGRAWVVGMVGAGEWAQQLAASGRPAGDCLKLDTIFPSYPPEGQLESYCVREYARLTHDPAACEILMPSRAGLDCVGGAKDENACVFTGGYVWWNEGRTSLNWPEKECWRGILPQSRAGKACCRISLATALRQENDCSPLVDQPIFHDECLYRVAFKNHDPAFCEPIQNLTLKTACTLQVNALRQDPSICQGCRKPVEAVEELLEL